MIIIDKTLIKMEGSPPKEEAYEQFVAGNARFPPASPHRASRTHYKLPKESERTAVTAEKLYQTKKHAYHHYIREIYCKINEELKKKNTFLTVTSNGRHVDCSLSLTAKELRPLKPDPRDQDKTIVTVKDKSLPVPRERFEDMELRRKLVGEKMRLEKLHDDTSSIERIRKKLMEMRKEDEQEHRDIEQRKQKLNFSRTQREIMQKQLNPNPNPNPPQHLPKRQFFKEKRRERIYSMNVTATKGVSDDFVMNRFLFGKKEPFVCGLGEKQGAQERAKERVLAYLDFLWKANFACGLFVRSQPEEVIYRAYVGSGNNSLMVKAILKRRFWWTLSQKPEGCHLVWTQLKVNSLFPNQPTSPSPTHISNTDAIVADEDDPHRRLFNGVDMKHWQRHLQRNSKNEVFLNERTYLKRAGLLACKTITRVQDNQKLLVHNHLEQNYYIGNKKALFYNLRAYYSRLQRNVFEALPLTFHIVKGVDDPQYKLFFNYYSQLQENKRRGEDERNIWIVKPGEFSNRGHGISVCHSLDDVLVRLKGKEKSSDGSPRTFILQKYLEKPLLYKSRKFDIRHYLLVSCVNGAVRAYWYPQGYLRTSSAPYSLSRNADLLTHLTNDAVQKHSQDYGRYQRGNKVSYEKFQAYLDKNLRAQQKGVFFESILPQMKQLAIDAVKATYFLLDPRRRQHNFQLLGMDFMIDQTLKPWLIEINTNPCLELSSPLLSRLIPALVENSFRLCLDPLFPPPDSWPTGRKFALSEDALADNRFQLIFDESVHGKEVEQLFAGEMKAEAGMGKVEEDAEVYENEGVEEWQEAKKEES